MRRPSLRATIFSVAAFALMSAAAVLFRYDRPDAASPSQAQVLLDTRLSWASASASAKWPPVFDAHTAYLWDRSCASCDEIGPRGERGATWYTSALNRGTTCPPVVGDGRTYVAADPGNTVGELLAFDITRPAVLVTHRYRNVLGTSRERLQIWGSGWPKGIDFTVSGMVYDQGRLYVGLDNNRLGGGIMAFKADTGAPMGWVPVLAGMVGPPVLATLPDGAKIILGAFADADESGRVLALDADTGHVSWSLNLPFAPNGPPAESGGHVVVGGVGENGRPTMVGLDSATAALFWQFQSPHITYGSRRPGGVAAIAEDKAGGSAYFACGRWIYAAQLTTGRLRWEQAPEIDPQAVAAVNTIVTRPISSKQAHVNDPDPQDLPLAPWLTGPAVHADEVLIGTPDGVRALASGDGRVNWRLPQSEVGAVDMPPLLRDGVAYVVGQGWVGADFAQARSRWTYAIRLDGPPAAPILTAPPGPFRHWHWLAASAALLALWATTIAQPKAIARGPRWTDALPACLVLASLVILIGWAAEHRPIYPGAPPNAVVSTNRGQIPAGISVVVLGLTFTAVWFGAWRGRKLAVAAMLSLTAAAAVTTLWVRGQRTEESAGVTTYQLRRDRVVRRSFRFVSSVGGIRFERTELELPLAAGLLEARDPQPFFWSRTFQPCNYPFVGLLRPGLDKGFARQWRRFEAQSRSVFNKIDQSLEYKLASVTAPDWSLLAPAPFFPAAWLIRAALRWRRRRRVRTGRCLACNYSLTGNISGVCPECGTPTLPPRPTSGSLSDRAYSTPG
jgi:outer membrane protein assembly factor BamB